MQKNRAGSIVRVAVVGVGYVGEHHARIYAGLPEVQLVGVIDADPSRAKAVSHRVGSGVISSFEDLAGAVDAVSIAVPTPLHYSVALQLLQQDIDVLLEKPMTVTLQEADTLIHEAERRGRILQIGHVERYNTAVTRLCRMVRDVRFIECHRLGPFVNRGTDVHVILDLMIHDLDLIVSLVRSPVREIRAVGASVLTPYIDIANARIEFVNGTVSNVTASRISQRQMRKIRVFQPDAYLSLDCQSQEISVVRRVLDSTGSTPRIEHEKILVEREEPLRLELAAFIRSVQTRERPLVSGYEGREALKVALDIVEEINAVRSLA